ncbi:hypothetical protein [Mycobacterium sp. TY813]|uniref:hypothetical protein n=1 Tax=Mycobacterium TaxID=1763 RepID=UPI002740F29B|nr:hypothetical protein [Mycobacterium sp. TY813]MDP7731505.1 hypothetical protein [Mycobacterium sp. TY813]
MINVSDSQARLIRDLVAEAVLNRQRHGHPIPDRVRDILRYVSVGGRPIEPVAPPLRQDQDDPINSDQAAEILDCSTRHIRRIATDLDGQNIGRRWVFSRRTVTDYAKARTA